MTETACSVYLLKIYKFQFKYLVFKTKLYRTGSLDGIVLISLLSHLINHVPYEIISAELSAASIVDHIC